MASLARCWLAVAAGAVPVLANGAVGQRSQGGFIARLGADTVHLERFERDGDRVSGVVLQRTPAYRLVRWSATLDPEGTLSHYEAASFDANGAPVLNGATGSLDWAGDTVVRVAHRNGQAETGRFGSGAGVVPSPSLPYIGVTYLAYEWGFSGVRRRAAAGGDTTLGQLSLVAAQRAPSRTQAWLVGRDSAELSYFGVARSGYRFDASGQLVSADWTGTTYRYRVERLAAVDLDGPMRAWSDAERRRAGFGALSPRDSAHGTVGSAHLTLDYSRPAVRGRRIWGDVVPWNAVWRLGADMATHFTTDSDLDVGGAVVPAGRYTLWMLPSETAPMLIVSRAVNVFGTMYDPSRDLARVPLTRRSARDAAERLTLVIAPAGLEIRWADAVWSVPVATR